MDPVVQRDKTRLFVNIRGLFFDVSKFKKNDLLSIYVLKIGFGIPFEKDNIKVMKRS